MDLVTGAVFRPVRLDSECYEVKVTPDQRRLFVLNGKSLTAVNSMTGQVEKTIRTTGHLGGEGDDFLIAPDGRTVYVADSFKGVVVIPVPY
jgi:DNA-binding beta-propeller fold protein YncE